MTETTTRDTFYIDGQWVAPTGNEFIEVENPATEEIIGKVPAGAAADVDRAVAAARAAFDGWAATAPEER
ncbi:MAG TPA: aldehyde dehydrogenase family protein, partial [Mycobacteriales bacterium]|nr:aldehyde dehydrogenase family protein [Mycobacteriales bacterium]